MNSEYKQRHVPFLKNRIDFSQSPNEIIGEIYSMGCVKDQEGKPRKELIGSAIPFDQGMALYKWIRTKKLKQTLEIGMGYGLSTLFICQAHLDNGQGGHHVSMDPNQGTTFQSIGLLNVKRAKLDDFLEFYQAASYEVLPQLCTKDRKFDFIYIDGMHMFDYALVDFFYSDLLLNVGGYIVLDDIGMPAIRKVLTYILRNRRYRLEPEFLSDASPIWQRLWTFLYYKTGRKRRVKMNIEQFIQNPFDVLTFFHMANFGLRGGLSFWGIQKVAEDNRQWGYHTAF